MSTKRNDISFCNMAKNECHGKRVFLFCKFTGFARFAFKCTSTLEVSFNTILIYNKNEYLYIHHETSTHILGCHSSKL